MKAILEMSNGTQIELEGDVVEAIYQNTRNKLDIGAWINVSTFSINVSQIVSIEFEGDIDDQENGGE